MSKERYDFILNDKDFLKNLKNAIAVMETDEKKSDPSTQEVYQVMLKNIRKTREDKGISQKKMAEAIGVTPNFLSAFERGEKRGSAETVISISRALKTPLSVLAHDNESGEVLPELQLYLSALPSSEQERVLKVIKAMYEN